MTYTSAKQFHIENRGAIDEGYMADIVVFDAATVRDNATYERPHQYPTGMHVIVNGVPAVDPIGLTGARPGRPIYGAARAPQRSTP